GYTKVIAPISGRVSRYVVTVGNLVQAGNQGGGTLLTTIVSVDPMYAWFDVDEHTALRVRQLAREGKSDSPRDGGYPVSLGLANEEGHPTREPSTSRTTRSTRGPEPSGCAACSPTRTRSSSPGCSPASGHPSAGGIGPCWSASAPWTPTRARRSSTSS